MKLFLFTLFIAVMYGLPVYLYDNLLLPQVNQLQTTYRDAGNLAESIASSN